MPQPDFVVVEIVRGRDLDAAAAECRIDVGVADDRDVALGERQTHAAADQMPVALVVRMHGDGRVAEQGFRPRGRDHEKAAAVA